MNISVIARLAIFVLPGLLTACGGGGSTTPDTTAPTVLSSTPANGASGVSAIADLTVTLSEAIDPATVTGTNVQLTQKNPFGRDDLAATVSYDAATHTITVNPNKPLARYLSDKPFTLTLTNIQDTAGNTMARTAITFKIYVSPVSQQVFY
jgi:methionine-rich copper-binding protein CopC